MASVTLKLEPNEDGSTSYYPGHFLKGTVELTLESPKKVRGFYVQIYGKGKCQWTKGSGKTKQTYIGVEIYLHSRTYLFGEYGGPTLEMQAGTHKYNFSGQLPYQLPYSLSLGHGTISFHAKAVLDIPWKIDKDAKVDFTILRYEDLNLYPELRTALRCKETKNFISFNESNDLHMSATIPCRGFAINQFASVVINYDNKSSVDITGTKIKLIQITIFNSPLQSKTKEKKSVVKEVRFEGVQARNSKTIQAGIKIPKVMTSNEKYSQVIMIGYFIEVEAEASGMHMNPKVTLPVTIGTAPLIFNDQFKDPQMMQPTVAKPQKHMSVPAYGLPLKSAA